MYVYVYIYIYSHTHICIHLPRSSASRQSTRAPPVTRLIQICDETHSHVWLTATHCNTLQHTATHCNWLNTVTRLIHMYDATYSYVWHHSFICVTWLVHMCKWLTNTCDLTHVYKKIFHVAQIHMCAACDMTQTLSHVWRDWFICVTWPLHMCQVTHPYVWLDWFICVTWLNHMCDVTHSYVWHDSDTRGIWLIHLCATWLIYINGSSRLRQSTSAPSVTWRIHMSNMTQSHVFHDSFICAIWRRNTSDMTNSCVGNNSLIRLTGRIHSCYKTHLYIWRAYPLVWHDSLICVTWLIELLAPRAAQLAKHELYTETQRHRDRNRHTLTHTHTCQCLTQHS